MIPLDITDVLSATRALLMRPEDQRLTLALRLIDEGRAAHDHWATTGRAHPRLGTGSLMAASTRYPRSGRVEVDDPEHRAALALMLRALDMKGISPLPDGARWPQDVLKLRRSGTDKRIINRDN